MKLKFLGLIMLCLMMSSGKAEAIPIEFSDDGDYSSVFLAVQNEVLIAIDNNGFHFDNSWDFELDEQSSLNIGAWLLLGDELSLLIDEEVIAWDLEENNIFETTLSLASGSHTLSFILSDLPPIDIGEFYIQAEDNIVAAAPIPEPATCILFGVGLGGLALRNIRKKA